MNQHPKVNHIERAKETIAKNKQLHYEFRHFYTPRQLKLIGNFNIAMLIYGAFGLFSRLISKKQTTDLSNHIFISIILLSLCLFGWKKIEELKKDRSDERKEQIFEILSMVNAIGYLGWGYAVFFMSIKFDHDHNFLIIMIVYAVCSFFFYFSIHHYYVFFILCIASLVFTGCYFGPGSLNNNDVINVIIFGAVMTLAGVSKYTISSKQFFAQRDAEKFRENLEANNEELTETNARLVELTDTLKKRNEAQKLFTASMSHELRSPLNGIIGLLQVLEDDKTLSPESKDNVDKSLSSAVTLISIVNDLLDYYKLEAGEFNIIEGPFDLREVAEGVETVSKEAAEAKNLELRIEAPFDMPCMFKGDGLRIKQIVTNLVSNGIKYTENGFVHTFFSYKDGILQIDVKDSGRGIEKEAQEALFDPFKRFNELEHRYIQGTGLGLSIVKKLVTQMKGEVSLESEVGDGSVFTVRLPIVVTDVSVKYGDERQKKQIEDEVRIDLTGRKLLCIDDNRVNLAVFKGLLKGTNAEIKMLLGGKECLEEVKKEKYDIIFMDHLMPEMDGIETFEAMRRTEHLNENTPVVMLTANAGAEAEQKYMQHGFSAYLSKPVLRADLFEVIKNVLK